MIGNIYSFLGLAARAGRLVSGEAACERALKCGRVSLVIIAGDASRNTREKFSGMCSHRGIQIRFFGEKELLGKYTGKDIRAVIGVTERNFAKRLAEMIDSCSSESGGEQIGEN